jgi:hypothetical protein
VQPEVKGQNDKKNKHRLAEEGVGDAPVQREQGLGGKAEKNVHIRQFARGYAESDHGGPSGRAAKGQGSQSACDKVRQGIHDDAISVCRDASSRRPIRAQDRDESHIHFPFAA